MTDVLKKIIEANEVKNGSVTITDKTGNIQSLEPDINSISGLETVSGVLDARFDDTNYYST